jgi:hypothetical protein
MRVVVGFPPITPDSVPGDRDGEARDGDGLDDVHAAASNPSPMMAAAQAAINWLRGMTRAVPTACLRSAVCG